MKKTFIKRALLGFPLGMSIGYTMSIIFSLFFADGYYGSVHPELIGTFGTEIAAVIIQAIIWGLFGSIYAGFSVIWENDNLSIVKQTAIVFSAYLLPTFLAGYILKWFKFSIWQVIIFILIFVFIFFVIWILIYLKNKKDVDALNLKIKEH